MLPLLLAFDKLLVSRQTSEEEEREECGWHWFLLAG